jgi:hypothetical protein
MNWKGCGRKRPCLDVLSWGTACVRVEIRTGHLPKSQKPFSRLAWYNESNTILRDRAHERLKCLSIFASSVKESLFNTTYHPPFALLQAISFVDPFFEFTNNNWNTSLWLTNPETKNFVAVFCCRPGLIARTWNLLCGLATLSVKTTRRQMVVWLKSNELGRDLKGNAFGIAPGYGLDGRELGVRVPVQVRFILIPRRPVWLCGQPSLLSNTYRRLCPRR